MKMLGIDKAVSAIQRGEEGELYRAADNFIWLMIGTETVQRPGVGKVICPVKLGMPPEPGGPEAARGRLTEID